MKKNIIYIMIMIGSVVSSDVVCGANYLNPSLAESLPHKSGFPLAESFLHKIAESEFSLAELFPHESAFPSGAWFSSKRVPDVTSVASQTVPNVVSVASQTVPNVVSVASQTSLPLNIIPSGVPASVGSAAVKEAQNATKITDNLIAGGSAAVVKFYKENPKLTLALFIISSATVYWSVKWLLSNSKASDLNVQHLEKHFESYYKNEEDLAKVKMSSMRQAFFEGLGSFITLYNRHTQAIAKDLARYKHLPLTNSSTSQLRNISQLEISSTGVLQQRMVTAATLQDAFNTLKEDLSILHTYFNTQFLNFNHYCANTVRSYKPPMDIVRDFFVDNIKIFHKFISQVEGNTATFKDEVKNQLLAKMSYVDRATYGVKGFIG